jgi:drug/metabolite transporter (DMT)-like permease
MKHTSEHSRAALLLVGAGLMLTLEVVVLRILGDRVSYGQVLVFRSGVQLLHTLAWIAALGGFAAVYTTRPGAHLLRALLSIAAWTFYYASFRGLDMALASTLSFTAHIFVVVLAGPLLGERPSALRAVCTLVGFSGIAIASHFWDARVFDSDIAYGLAAALCGAAIIIATRSLAQTERMITMLFYIGCATFLAALPVAWLTWMPIGLEEVLLLLLLGGFGYVGMWLMIEAYSRAEATALAPYPYTRLLFASSAGFIVFSETPPLTTFIGAVLIIGATLTLTLAERSRRPAATSPADGPVRDGARDGH